MILRKLTFKSVMKFGKYKDLTVQEVIDLHQTSYLRWCYFANSHINFFDDVLEAICLPKEYKIDKPGTDIAKHKIVNELNFAKIHWKSKQHLGRVKRIKASIRMSEIAATTLKTPAILMDENRNYSTHRK